MSIVTDHVLELLEPIDERLKVKPRLTFLIESINSSGVIMGIILPSLLLQLNLFLKDMSLSLTIT